MDQHVNGPMDGLVGITTGYVLKWFTTGVSGLKEKTKEMKMLLREHQLVAGKYYRLICDDKESGCNNAILRALELHRGGRVIHPGHPSVSSQKGRGWGFIASDRFEEISDEEATVYLLSD